MLPFSRAVTPRHACPPETTPDPSEIIPMKLPDPKTFDITAFHLGAPTFTDVILYLGQNPELFETRTRDMISGLRGVARALGRPPEAVPADPRWLQLRLNKVQPA